MTRPRRKDLSRMCAAAIAAALFVQPPLHAQQKPQDITADDIFALVEKGTVTTATKTERALKAAPMAVTVITRQELEAIGAVTISDALRLVPGMNTHMSPMGQMFGVRSLGSSPFSTRVLILVDGAPYNSPDKGGLSAHPEYGDILPIEHVKRIEVVKGPGSALYGQNAYQGIINIITRDTTDLKGTEFDISGGARDTGDVRLSHGGTKGDVNYSFTGRFKREFGPMEFQRDSEIRGGEGYVKLGYKGLDVSYLAHRDTFGSFAYGTSGKTIPTEQTLNQLSVAHTRQINPRWSSTFKTLYNRRDGNTCANCHDLTGTGSLGPTGTPAGIKEEHETNQRFWLTEQINFKPAAAPHNFLFGGEYQLDRTVKSIVERLDSQPNIGTVGAFAQDEIELARKRVLVTLGARIDNNQVSGSSFSPTGSLVYLAGGHLTLRGSVGRAFRQPTWNDLFIDQRFRPIATVMGGVLTEFRRVGNPELEPERITTVQGGAEYIRGAYSAKVDIFHSTLANYILGEDFTVNVGGPGQPPRPAAIGPGPAARLAFATNREDDIHTHGAELEFRARPNKYASAIVGYAYMQHDLDETVERQAAYVPKHKVTMILSATPHERVSINFDMNSWSHFNSTSPGLTLGLTAQQGLLFGEPVGESFAVANVNVNLLLLSTPKAKFGVVAQLRNLLDKRTQTGPVFNVDTSMRGRETFFKLYARF